jgi:hypothetical protein
MENTDIQLSKALAGALECILYVAPYCQKPDTAKRIQNSAAASFLASMFAIKICLNEAAPW